MKLAVTTCLSFTLACLFSARPALAADRSVRDVPKLVLAAKLKLANLYLENNEDCSKANAACDLRVEDEVLLGLENEFSKSIDPLLQKLDTWAEKSVPDWSTKRTALFPISFRLSVSGEMINAGSRYSNSSQQIFDMSGSSSGFAIEPAKVSIGIQKSSPQAVGTFAVHEAGHMFLRVIGFPVSESSASGRIDALTEEAICDFISSTINGFTPYIGAGLQDDARAYVQAKLDESNLDAFQRAFMEQHLLGISTRSVRDFSSAVPYSREFALPGHYVTSMVFNSALYKLGSFIERSKLASSVMELIVRDPSLFNSGDMNAILQRIVQASSSGNPTVDSSAQLVLAKLGFKSPVVSSSAILVKESGSQTAKDVGLTLAPEILADLASATQPSVIYNLTQGSESKFSFAQFVGYSMQQLVRLTPVPSCDSTSPLCVCGSAPLHISATYLSRIGQITRTQPAPISLPTTSSCASLTIEWAN